MKYVQNGDIKRLKELLNSSQNLVEGIVAGNALRQKKNIFITIATLTTRAAIQGGMNLEEAYQPHFLTGVMAQNTPQAKDHHQVWTR